MSVPETALQPSAVEERFTVDHFDGGLVREQTQPIDNKQGESKRSVDKEGLRSQGDDIDRGRDQTPIPTDERNLQSSAAASEDKFETSSRGDTERGLKDGDRYRTRRKESASWADEVEESLKDDQKVYSSFEYEMSSGPSSQRDEGRATTQYSRQERRKRHDLYFFFHA